MKIDEAVRQAIACDGYIRRAGEHWDRVKVKPTNARELCCVSYAKGMDPRRYWNPCAEDLMADDWMVAKELEFPEKEVMRANDNCIDHAGDHSRCVLRTSVAGLVHILSGPGVLGSRKRHGTDQRRNR